MAASGSIPSAQACSIFVLTDGQRALFGNNEDWSNPNTRIWFVSATNGHYGCVYVGFDNGWAQGGMNTKGVAFDWVAGFKEPYQPDPSLRQVPGNPSERMLETCANIEEAMNFYRSNREPSFTYAKILVADGTGASFILGAGDGRLHFERTNCSRGFGYGGATLQKMLAENPAPSVTNASRILRTCAQKGAYATKYSNVFDLKSQDIFLFPFPGQDQEVSLNLAAELKKGEHYYAMAAIDEQMKQPPKSLPSVAHSKPIPDKEPKVTAHVRALIQDAIGGTMRGEDYTDETWKEIAPKQQSLQSQLRSMGDLVSLTLVDRSEQGGKRTYRYLVEFKTMKVLQRFVFDGNNKVEDSDSEDVQAP
jgi:hypothetical protein